MTSEANPATEDPRDYSDAELVAAMRTRMAEQNWTLAQVREVERRGLSALDADPELRDAVASRMEAQAERMRELLKPMLASIKIPSVELPDDWLQHMPTVPQIQPIELYDFDSPAVQQAEILAATKIIHEATLTAIRDVAENTRRDVFHWILFTAALVAAITGALSLFM